MYDWQEEPPAEEPEDTYEDTTPQDNYEDVTPPAPSSGTGGKTAVAIYDYQAGKWTWLELLFFMQIFCFYA